MKRSLMQPGVIYLEEDEYRKGERRIEASAILGDKVYAISVLVDPVKAKMLKEPVSTKQGAVDMVRNSLDFVTNYGHDDFERIMRGRQVVPAAQQHHWRVEDLTKKTP